MCQLDQYRPWCVVCYGIRGRVANLLNGLALLHRAHSPPPYATVSLILDICEYESTDIIEKSVVRTDFIIQKKICIKRNLGFVFISISEIDCSSLSSPGYSHFYFRIGIRLFYRADFIVRYVAKLLISETIAYTKQCEGDFLGAILLALIQRRVSFESRVSD